MEVTRINKRRQLTKSPSILVGQKNRREHDRQKHRIEGIGLRAHKSKTRTVSDGGLRVVGQLNDEQITSLSVVTISPASQVHWQYINDGMTHEYQTMFALCT